MLWWPEQKILPQLQRHLPTAGLDLVNVAVMLRPAAVENERPTLAALKTEASPATAVSASRARPVARSVRTACGRGMVAMIKRGQEKDWCEGGLNLLDTFQEWWGVPYSNFVW
jgi:hypothetical protein